MYNFLRKIKYIIKSCLFYFKDLSKFIFYFFKINKNKIVFINFNGRGYGCNPKYIAQYLIKNNYDCKIVWLVRDIHEPMPRVIKKVKYGSIKSYYEMATAKIWVSNTRNYKFAIKKKDQFYIQTWHASLMLKKVEGEAEELLDSKYIKEAKLDSINTNLIISDNDINTYIYKNNFWYNGEVLNIGIPRNDILFSPPNEVIEKVYNYYNIPKNKKLILYAPTFRDNFNYECIKLDYERILCEFNNKFDDTFVLLVRLHPNITRFDKFIKFSKNVISATNYPDNQELLAVCQIGITDYSSISFEISMTNKPVFLICKDYENYENKERGLKYKLSELPFSFALNEDELINNIRNFSYEQYIKKCNDFFDSINMVKDSDSSKRLCEIIMNKID